MTRLLISAIAVLLISVASVVPAHANLVLNGNFEAGAEYWIPAGNDYAGGYQSSGGNPNGFFLLNAGGEYGTNPTIAQGLTGLDVGRAYTVTWDQLYYYPGNAGPYGFGVFAGSYPIDPVHLNGYTGVGWATFTAYFTAISSSEVLLFAAELDPWVPGVPTTTDMGYGIDNVSVEASSVPLPGALLLFAPGLVGLAAVRRRFKK